MTSGAASGQINAYLGWDADSVIETATEWRVTLKLAPNAPRDQAIVTVTPRRLSKFKRKPGERVTWAIEGSGLGRGAEDRGGHGRRLRAHHDTRADGHAARNSAVHPPLGAAPSVPKARSRQ